MHNSNSQTQMDAEEIIRKNLYLKYKWNLISETIKFPNGTSVQIDGVDRVNKIAVEIISRIGESSSSRDDKIASDALKLNYLTTSHPDFAGYEKRIVGCCEEFLKNFGHESKRWVASAIGTCSVKVEFVEISEEERLKILTAQGTQAKF